MPTSARAVYNRIFQIELIMGARKAPLHFAVTFVGDGVLDVPKLVL